MCCFPEHSRLTGHWFTSLLNENNWPIRYCKVQAINVSGICVYILGMFFFCLNILSLALTNKFVFSSSDCKHWLCSSIYRAAVEKKTWAFPARSDCQKLVQQVLIFFPLFFFFLPFLLEMASQSRRPLSWSWKPSPAILCQQCPLQSRQCTSCSLTARV